MAKFYVKKEVICKHCQQITLFEDCLIEVEAYSHFVCWYCLKRYYLSCEGCDRHYVIRSPKLKWLNNKDDGKVCQVCIDEGLYVYCRECRKLFVKEECKFHDNLNGHVCGECLKQKYHECSFCKKHYRRDDIEIDNEGEKRCKDCEEDWFRCRGCNTFFSTDEVRLAEDATFCERCFNGRFRVCEFCDEVFDRDILCSHEGGYYCCSCAGERNLPLLPFSGQFIQGYGFKPSPKFYRLKGDDKLHFGLELEVENVEYKVGENKMIEKYLIPIFGNYIYYKHDSSINNGFELVTHPFTWRWFKENRKMWEDGLEVLRKKGFQSYEVGRCGIHIHMSKKAFGNTHLFKFLKFFYENHDFLYKISQRDEFSSSGGCQWGRNRDRKDQKTLLDKAKKKRGFDRHTAVNLEQDDTYEIRIFRGTLNQGSFFKNIEFCKASFEFSNNVGISKVGVEEFKRYVGNERKVYKNLFEFMEKKGVY